MNSKLIMIMAIDTLLLEIDTEYEEVPRNVHDLVQLKVYEEYGLTLDSTYEEVEEMKKRMIEDIKKFREELIVEVTK